MSIVIVDDERVHTTQLQSILQRAGFTQLRVMRDPRQATQLIQEKQPDLLLLDLYMAHMNGFQVLSQLETSADVYFPIILLTSDPRPEIKVQASAQGVRDFLSKPFDPWEVRQRVNNLLEARALYLAGARQQQQLDSAEVEMLVRLAKAAEYHDDAIGEHVWRVAKNAAAIAEALHCPKQMVRLLLRAARLHDVGKIALPDALLRRHTPLSPEEQQQLREHTRAGAALLSGGRSALMHMAEVIALHHHECWDGSGYPQGLQGEAIPLEARIVAVADALDEATAQLSSAEEMPACLERLYAQAGTRFDPAVIAALQQLQHDNKLELNTQRWLAAPSSGN